MLRSTRTWPLSQKHHWEEVEKIGRGQVAVITLLEFFVATTHHHLEAARLSQDARARALKEKSPPDGAPDGVNG